MTRLVFIPLRVLVQAQVFATEGIPGETSGG